MLTNDKVLAVIDNVIRLKLDTLKPDFVNELRQTLTRDNPDYHRMKAMRSRNRYKYQHAKMPAATLTSLHEDYDTLYVPRGFKTSLDNIARSHNITIEYYRDTIFFPPDQGMYLNESVVLADYQSKTLSLMGLNTDGIAVAPCGAGKTVMGIASICQLKQPTLILVHTNDLMEQWRNQLASLAVLPGGVGQWGAGIKQRGQVTVGMIQALIRLLPEELAEFMSHFGYVLLDEAHHCPAETFLKIMQSSKARYRHGLTATPKRKDGLEFLMTDTIGPQLTIITDDDLVSAGRSQSCVVNLVNTTFFSKHTADEWTKLLGQLVNDMDRNSLIVRNVLKDWEAGNFPLILSDRVGHCKDLQSRLRKAGMNAQLLTGSVAKPVRTQIIEMSKNGLIDCIIATKVADEGLDIPNLSSIHLTCPTQNEGKLNQRIGRIRRPLEGKGDSVIYDYIDTRIPSGVRMAKSRQRLYRKWGFKIN